MVQLKGVSWEEGFCDGLVKSRCFLPLLSRGSSDNFTKLASSSPCDNVLLEYNLALELRERGLIDFIYPVLIGDFTVDATDPNTGNYSKYFQRPPLGCHPDLSLNGSVCVTSIVNKLQSHLHRLSLGSLLLDQSLTIKWVVDSITINQGFQIEGEKKKAFEELIRLVCEMVGKGVEDIRMAEYISWISQEKPAK